MVTCMNTNAAPSIDISCDQDDENSSRTLLF